MTISIAQVASSDFGSEQLVLEEIASDGLGNGLEAERQDSRHEPEIKAPFDPAMIDVITQARTVDLLLTRLREGEMNLTPDFQRRGNLWNDRRKSGLIESMLLRIPIPSLYVSEDIEGNYTVVDGLQRMCAIAHFVEVTALNKAVGTDLQPLQLSGLQSLPPEYNGAAYERLPRPLQRRISETELTLHVIRASTPPAVKFNIFSRINQGGLPLTPQEIRNAIYPGEWRNQIRQMSRCATFLAATENKIRGERMEDLELVLRFVAHFAAAPDFTRPDDQNLDDFLNDFVVSVSPRWSAADWEQVSVAFDRAMDFARQIFGMYAFRKFRGPDRHRSPINRGLFESVSVALARRSVNQLVSLADRRNSVLEKFEHRFESDDAFSSALLYATGRGSSATVRTKTVNMIFDEVLA